VDTSGPNQINDQRKSFKSGTPELALLTVILFSFTAGAFVTKGLREWSSGPLLSSFMLFVGCILVWTAFRSGLRLIKNNQQ
jgi:hypothetical protein